MKKGIKSLLATSIIITSTVGIPLQVMANSNDSSFTTELSSMDENLSTLYASAELSSKDSDEKFENDKYIYNWTFDGSVGGYETTTNVVEPLKPIFGDKVVDQSQVGSSYKLEREYNVLLSDEEESWNNEYAAALLKIFKMIPHRELKQSKWILAEDEIPNDIEIDKTSKGYVVRISEETFKNATPRMATIEDIEGTYFSKKLHKAAVRFITNEGKDKKAITKILKDRFNVAIYNVPYSKITKYTTKENSERFQEFKKSEILYLLTALEEMPEGFHKINGLKYIARRKDGFDHPLHPAAPAVAWPSSGYIEFMESAFKSQDSSYILKLIVHEKTHFLWDKLFDDKLREDWIELGGWFKNEDDSDGWSTTKTTSFASAYAHAHNPNEDMAESVSYYIFNPDKLRSVAPEKYDFIRNRIMSGDRYISQIREDLQFRVYNLAPDYEYPGKIKNVNIEVNGAGDEDKKAKISIKLDIQGREDRKAKYAYMRIFSPAGTFTDLYLMPERGRESDVLTGTLNIPSKAKGGYWHVEEIVVGDTAGNERFEGVEDFGWKLYINNDEEDTTAPKFVKDSLEYELRNDSVEGRDVQILNVRWDFIEKNSISSVFARLNVPNQDRYTEDKYGKVNKDGKAEVEFIIPDYYPTGEYSIRMVSLKDKAMNRGSVTFSNHRNDQKPVFINIETTNADTTRPSLDVNNINVKATPVNKEKPDGETLVNIEFKALDDISGIGKVTYRLRSPHGKSIFEYLYHDNTYTTFFKGNPDEEKTYKIKHMLPKGSEPGIWGVENIVLYDKAGNKMDYNFTEIIHFEVSKK